MQLSPTASGARYGGSLTLPLRTDHPAYSPGWDGEYQIDPRIVITGPAVRRDFASLADAIEAAKLVSAGDRDAVAVVRDPGTAGPWHVDRLLVKGHFQDRYAGIDLATAALRKPDESGRLDVYQPLISQRQVIVGALVDGDLVYDEIGRHSSSRPDLPGRDPDKGGSGS